MKNRRLKIIVIGYYGKLNAGDDLLQQSICHIFQEHDLLFTSWFPGTDFLNTADLIVVGGGSIWPGNPFFENGKKIAKQLKKPLIILGISTKNSNPDVLEQTLPLIEKSLYFHVRDSDSKKILGDDERITVGPDLYWWSPHETPVNTKSEFNNCISLNLRSWKEMEWSPDLIITATKKFANSVLPYPLYFGSLVHENQGDLQDVTLLESSGIEHVPRSFTVRNLEKSSITIAMRFHALLISMRSGQPIIGFDYHKKITSLFREINMSELCVPLNDHASLENALQLTINGYAEYKERIMEVSDRHLHSAQTNRNELEAIVRALKPSGEPGFTRYKRLFKRFLA